MMKRRTMTLAAAILAAALPALAQGPRMGGGQGPGAGPGRGLDFLAGYLGLSEAQKASAKTIFDAAKTASESLAGQMTAAREALQTAIKTSAPDTELDRLSAAIGTIDGQLTAVHAKSQAKFYALLTAEQKQKYDDMHSKMGGPRGR